jgi:hypothetical protein
MVARPRVGGGGVQRTRLGGFSPPPRRHPARVELRCPVPPRPRRDRAGCARSRRPGPPEALVASTGQRNTPLIGEALLSSIGRCCGGPVLGERKGDDLGDARGGRARKADRQAFGSPTGGVGRRQRSVAFLWLPVPAGADLVTKVLYREERWVALPDDHRLAEEASVPWSELLDEQFIALPRAAGLSATSGSPPTSGHPINPPRVVSEAANADEAFELIAAGVGVALVSAGNARIYQRPGARSIAVSRLAQ